MRKILTITLLAMIVFSNIYCIYAADEKQVELKYIGHCGELFKIPDRVPNYSYVVYENNGQRYPVYCLNNERAGVSEGFEYPVKITGKLDNEIVWKVISNGYPYKTAEEMGVNSDIEAFVATKLAVNVVLGDYPENYYTSIGTDASDRVINAYKNLVDIANKSTQKQNLEPMCELLSDDNWKEDDIDPKCISKVYNVNSNIENGTYKAQVTEKIDGLKVVNMNNEEISSIPLNERFKILFPINKLGKEMEFNIRVDANLKSIPLLYGATTVDGTQNYALTGLDSERINCNYSDKLPLNKTTLRVIKKEDNTENRLKGVKFILMDQDKNIMMDSIVTDENGEIILSGIMPGHYFLQEVQTLEGFDLYTDLIEINIKFNEEANITINNTRKEVETNEIKEGGNDKNIDSNVVKNEIIDKNVKRLPVTGK